ncbi:MAG: hypothetical protein DRP46_00130 [Candidatus Zixiibacteriota bacterium]|nr:MAG: hypothetical protein DRP46_00130 [candidate division Zixibacteria bacterium]
MPPNEKDDRGFQPISEIDRTIHEPARFNLRRERQDKTSVTNHNGPSNDITESICLSIILDGVGRRPSRKESRVTVLVIILLS